MKSLESSCMVKVGFYFEVLETFGLFLKHIIYNPSLKLTIKSSRKMTREAIILFGICAVSMSYCRY